MCHHNNNNNNNKNNNNNNNKNLHKPASQKEYHQNSRESLEPLLFKIFFET